MPPFESKVILNLISTIINNENLSLEERKKMINEAIEPFIKEIKKGE